MLGPCIQLLSGASYCSNLRNKRNRVNSNSTRKIRMICYDPDVTDCSSDDEESYGLRKRIVQEINLLNSSSSSITSSPAVTEVSFQDSNNGENPISSNKKEIRVLDKPTTGSPSWKYRGLRQRRRGKWAAEIRHPLDGVRVWLGTYNTAEEASQAYELKKVEFDALGKSNKESCSEDSESLLSLSSPASTSSEMNASDEKVSENVEIQMLDCMSIKEPFECIDLQIDLDSLFVNDYGEVFDDFTLFNDLPIYEFDGLDQSIDLPGFDFELGKDELAWIDEALDIACCP